VELRVEGPGSDLAGTLALPESQPAPVLVYVYGATEGTRDVLLARHLGAILPRHGIGLLAFDRRGEGASRGDPNVSIETLAADVEVWLVRLRECAGVDPDRVGLFAHSQGGWVAPLVAKQARCLVAVSPIDVAPTLRAFGGPALLFLGGRDRWIPVDRTLQVWRDALGERLTVVRLEQAGHFPTRAEDPSDWTERGPILDEYELTLVRWLLAELRS
jgi:pimeloyl-ACP methyl ester carboxylesterase